MIYKNVILTLLSLYLLSLVTSMAGMEIVSWTLFATLVPLFWKSIQHRPDFKIFIWPLGLYAWSVFGALWQGFSMDRMTYVVGDFRWIFLLFGFSFAISLLLREKKRVVVTYAIPVALALLGIVAVYAIHQHFYGIDFVREGKALIKTSLDPNVPRRWRSNGFFSMPLTYAYSLGMAFFLFLPVALFSKNKKMISASATVLVLVFVSLITSHSRGAWVALAPTLPLALFMVKPKKQFVYLALFVAFVGLLAISVSSNFQDRLVSIVDMSQKSNYERVYIWQAFSKMFIDHPFMGVGYSIDGYKLMPYFEKMGVMVEYPGHAHNNFLQFLAVTGLVGFFLYCAMCISFMWFSWQLYIQNGSKVMVALGVGTLCAQLFFHIGGLTECNFFDAEVRHMLVWTWALIGTAKSHPELFKTYA